jgi:hypothetical protein
VAETTTSARQAAWKTHFSGYLTLKNRIQHASPEDRLELERALAVQFDLLIATPAPTVAAVARKLVLLWEADLAAPGRDGDEKRQIIADLDELIEEGTALFGSKPN